MPQIIEYAAVGIALALAGLCIVLIRASWVRNKQLKTIADALKELNEGNSNRKILMNTEGVTTEIAYGINELLQTSQNRVADLEQASQTSRVFMTSLSHDVRTPLTTLIGYLDAVHANIVEGEERERYVETARGKAYDMKGTIDTLFEWFKLNSNEEVLEPVPCDMAELTREVLEDWIVIFEEKQLTYDITLPECYMEAMVDRGAYARILNNLIQNVLAHSKATEIGILIKKDCNTISITVSDNGIGIAPGDVNHVFERLYKCDKSRTHRSSGIGLNIVQQLVEKMGGAVSVVSTQSVNTAFTVCFPIRNHESGSPCP